MPTEMEDYLFDLRGYLVIEKAVDHAELTALNAVVDKLSPSPQQEAERAGLASRVVPLGELLDEAVAVAEKGALPSYTHGYYGRSNRFYKEWDAIARDRDTFTLWLDENVYSKEENN